MEIKRVIADGKISQKLFIQVNTATTRFPSLVGVSHAKRKISKKAHNDLRLVLVDILSDVCSLDNSGEDFKLLIGSRVLSPGIFNRQAKLRGLNYLISSSTSCLNVLTDVLTSFCEL